MDLKGSQTEINLMHAYIGESQARNRYTFFASVAKKEGLVQIAAIFEETAAQEKEHAKRFYKCLQGGEVAVNQTVTAPVIGSTLDNLSATVKDEEHEWRTLYPGFAHVAREEGFPEIAEIFDAIAVAEKQHGRRFKMLAENLQTGRVFKRNGTVTWRCLNCGYLHEAEEAPELCPACIHPQAYFELLAENW